MDIDVELLFEHELDGEDVELRVVNYQDLWLALALALLADRFVENHNSVLRRLVLVERGALASDLHLVDLRFLRQGFFFLLTLLWVAVPDG